MDFQEQPDRLSSAKSRNGARGLAPPGLRAPGAPARRRRGITLLEMMVVVVVGTLVAGLLIGLLVSSERETDRDMRRAALLTAASSTLQTLSLWCERARAVAPASEERYEINHLRLLARDSETAEAVVFEVRPRDQRPDRVIETAYRVAAPGSPPPDDETAWIGFGGDERVWLSVRFQYAWEFDGVEPQWANTGDTKPDRPRVVKITVVAQDAQGRAPSVRLTSVVGLRDTP